MSRHRLGHGPPRCGHENSEDDASLCKARTRSGSRVWLYRASQEDHKNESWKRTTFAASFIDGSHDAALRRPAAPPPPPPLEGPAPRQLEVARFERAQNNLRVGT